MYSIPLFFNAGSTSSQAPFLIWLNLTKYENFDTTAVNGQESKSGSKGTLVQFNLKTGLKLAEGVDYVPFKQTSVTMELPWVGDYKPSRVEVITKSTQATNGGKIAESEYHSSTGIITIVAENSDYKDKVVGARDEYDIICIYKNLNIRTFSAN